MKYSNNILHGKFELNGQSYEVKGYWVFNGVNHFMRMINDGTWTKDKTAWRHAKINFGKFLVDAHVPRNNEERFDSIGDVQMTDLGDIADLVEDCIE